MPNEKRTPLFKIDLVDERPFRFFLMCSVLPGVVVALAALLASSSITRGSSAADLVFFFNTIVCIVWYFMGAWGALKYGASLGNRFDSEGILWLVLAVIFVAGFMAYFLSIVTFAVQLSG